MLVYDVMFVDEFDNELPTQYRFTSRQEAIDKAEELTNEDLSCMTYHFTKAIDVKD